MIPTAFDEENGVLDAPQGMSNCEPLSVWRGEQDDTPMVISCWKLTVEELEEINKTGKVWLWVRGQSMPPVALQTTHPFK
jgi:hypothetical protein